MGSKCRKVWSGFPSRSAEWARFKISNEWSPFSEASKPNGLDSKPNGLECPPNGLDCLLRRMGSKLKNNVPSDKNMSGISFSVVWIPLTEQYLNIYIYMHTHLYIHIYIYVCAHYLYTYSTTQLILSQISKSTHMNIYIYIYMYHLYTYNDPSGF